MKIALIGPVYPYRGGIAHYTTMVDRALHETGHDVLLVSFRRQYPQWLFPGDSDQDPSETPLRATAPNYWLDSLNPLNWLATLRRIRHAQVDAIVLQWWTTFFAPLWITLGILNRLFLRRPLVYICHNVLPHEPHVWDRWVAKATLRWGARFIVQSADEAQRLRTLLGEVEIAVIPHPVYDFLAAASMSKSEARRQLGLPDDAPVMLFFGIVREYKGLDTLLHALPQVLANVSDARLLIAGEFWESKSTYTALIDQLGIGDAITIDDRYIPNEEVGAYFIAADLLVAPYRRVTDSGALQMAHGFGLPVVKGQTLQARAPNDALNSDQLSGGELYESLAAEIIELLGDKEALSRSVVDVHAHSSWQDVVTAIVAPMT